MSRQIMRPCDYNDGYDDDDLSPYRDPAEDEASPWKPYPETLDGERLAPMGQFLDHLKRRAEMTKVCESPIEIDLGAALVAQAGDCYRIVPQFKLLRYRYDFAIMGQGKTPIVLVECDGAAFHSTKEQLANDAAKDDAAIRADTRVIRVTGREIYCNPHAWAGFIIGECRLEEQRRGGRS